LLGKGSWGFIEFLVTTDTEGALPLSSESGLRDGVQMTAASRRMTVRPSDPVSDVTSSELWGIGYPNPTKLGPREPLPEYCGDDPAGGCAFTQASTWLGGPEVEYQAIDVACVSALDRIGGL